MPGGTLAAHDQDEGSFEQTIGGRYALHGPMASGGMATVHFGRQLGAAGFARTVAIKRLHVEFLESAEFISTLLDEARLASRIRHPNVVATMDMVQAEDELFLVMEYIVGESLSRLLYKLHQQRERVPPKVATGVLCGVLHALHAAHEATDERGDPLGIVHRDVSPQNILVGVDGLARLLDFGIAKGKGRLQTTRAGQLKGKVGYMAPEQILGEDPDRRSDIYAASVVLWEVLTGQRLFPTSDKAADNFNLIPKILEAHIKPPSEVADVPKLFDGIVMRGLNRQRDARYETAREFAVALEDRFGVATNRQIGEWVERVAAAELAKRAEQVKRLEAPTTDRKSVERIADDTVKRRRRKRLASFSDESPPETRQERKAGALASEDLDPPTVVDDSIAPEAPQPPKTAPKQMDIQTEEESIDEEALKKTRVGMRQFAKQARAVAEARRHEELRETRSEKGDGTDDDDLHSTQVWRSPEIDDEQSDITTGVHVSVRELRGPPALPKAASAVEDEISTDEDLDSRPSLRQQPSADELVDDPSTLNAMAPRPSDFRPRTSSTPPSGRSEVIELPVRSNRWVVIVLVIAAAIAVAAAAFKMLVR